MRTVFCLGRLESIPLRCFKYCTSDCYVIRAHLYYMLLLLTHRMSKAHLALVQSLTTVRCSMKHFNSPGEWTMPIPKSDSDCVDVLLQTPSMLIICLFLSEKHTLACVHECEIDFIVGKACEGVCNKENCVSNVHSCF